MIGAGSMFLQERTVPEIIGAGNGFLQEINNCTKQKDMLSQKLLAILLISTIVTGCRKENTIPYNSDKISYQGRVEFSDADSAAILYWPGNSVAVRFKGTGVKALMKVPVDKNYFNIILDDSVFLFRPDSGKMWYTLGKDLKDTVHRIEIFRRMTASPFYFYAFKTTGSGTFLKPEKREKSIEFYGNSITEGASIHDHTGSDPELWDSTYTDNYLTYGAITARHYNADYTCIARGGIGLMVSWYPMIMPEMYDRLNPDDPDSKWDFSKNIPDIVVINLFQNDAALVNRPQHPQFKARFGDTPPDSSFIINSYYSFLKKIRGHYPDAKIICTLGSMTATRKDLPWRSYVKSAVKKMNDKDIYTYFFFYKGGYNHPKEAEHRRMADSLINFIDKNIEW
jgi:hypothetical protein